MHTNSVMPELGGLGRPGDHWPSQYLADQLSLFQPGRADYPHLLLLATPMFFTFRHHCNNVKTHAASGVEKSKLVVVFQFPITIHMVKSVCVDYYTLLSNKSIIYFFLDNWQNHSLSIDRTRGVTWRRLLWAQCPPSWSRSDQSCFGP